VSGAATVATGHHEAGHAAAALARGIPFSRVSIIPDKESTGHSKLLCAVQKLEPMHHRGIVAYWCLTKAYALVVPLDHCRPQN